MTTTQRVKLALKRGQSVPMGRPAPLHLDCPCGTRVEVPWSHEVLTCRGCGARYDRAGWQLHDIDESEWFPGTVGTHYAGRPLRRS